jgi:Na+-driven multidrug efflux pump
VIFLYNLTAGIIRSLGDSKTPLYFLIFASILNIILDVVFITVFAWGVVGAAVATVISQGISGILCLFYMSKKFEVLRMTKDDKKINSHLFPILCGQGVPMGLQYSITAIGSVILQASVNTLGSDAVASVTAGSKLGMFFVSPYDALGTTMSTWGGQNAGAGKYPRLKQGLFVSCVIVLYIRL